MQFPDNLLYTKDHEWVRVEGDMATVGVTDFAQGELGDIVYLEIESNGLTLNAHDVFGTVEAVKTTSDLFMPIAGKVLEFNPGLDDSKGGNPALINEDPYGEGWIVKIEIANPSDLNSLMDAAAYQAHVA